MEKKSLSVKERIVWSLIFLAATAFSIGLMFIAAVAFKSDLVFWVKFTIVIISGAAGLFLFVFCLRAVVFIILDAFEP